MRNLLNKLAVKGLLVAVIVINWLLDDGLFFLPTAAVDLASKFMFKVTGNSARYDTFMTFWNQTDDINLIR